jgi:hypothetical protein
MEQRPLRLGDPVDDYCPRERRVTNHAIVAIVNNSIRQTRCTTCDTEHVYREAKAPRRRPADGSEFDDPVTSNVGGQLVAPVAASAEATPPAAAEEPSSGVTAAEPPIDASPDEGAVDNRHEDGWPAHRPLIRATLPKVEGDLPPPRPIPEFTMHQRHGRGGQGFRGQGWQDRSGGSGRGGFRGPGRSAHGQGNGNVGGNGNVPGQGGRRHHGKKRSR